MSDEYLDARDELAVQKAVPPSDEESSIREVLRNRSFMLVFFGQVIENIGGMSVVIALMFLIYSTTQNPVLIGILQTVTILPGVILSPFAGVIVDRFDQRKIMFVSILVRVVTAIGIVLVYLFRNRLIRETVTYQPIGNGSFIAVTTISNLHFIWPLFVIFVLRVAIWPFFMPAKGAYTKLIIKEKNLLVANSMSTAILQIAGVIGPLLGGLLVALNYFIGFSFAIGASIISALFFLILVYIGRKPPENHIEKATSMKEGLSRVAKDIKIGVKTIRSDTKITYLLIIITLVSFVYAGIDVLWPVILQEDMVLTSTWYGGMEAFLSAIGVIVSLIILRLGKIDRKIIVFTLAVGLEGIGVFLMAFVRDPFVMMFLIMTIFGLSYSAIFTSETTLIQERVEYKKQGRVFSAVEFLRSIALLIGLTITTVLINYFRSSTILYFTGGIQILVVVIGLIIVFTSKALKSTDYKKLANGSLAPFNPSVEE
ncbi:MAG: MFS transporter [Candidatus Heimdallarchaeota archaeon]